MDSLNWKSWRWSLRPDSNMEDGEDGDSNDGEDGNDLSYLMITLMAECLNPINFLGWIFFCALMAGMLGILGKVLALLGVPGFRVEKGHIQLIRLGITKSSLWHICGLSGFFGSFSLLVYIRSTCINNKLKCIGDSCHLFLIPCHARLVIPWSSLATGKVSLEVSGIHIEAEGMWSCRIFTGCLRLGSIKPHTMIYQDYIDTCRILVDIHRSECSIPFFQMSGRNCRVPSNKIHFLPESPRLKWANRETWVRFRIVCKKPAPIHASWSKWPSQNPKKSSSEPCGM